MNEIGLNEMRTRIKDRDNIVIELIGENYDVVEEVIELGKKLDYNTKVDYLECDMDKAWQRNIERGDDNISAHFCEPFHLLWFKQAAIENIKAIN